jgi:hypothetical protein
MARCIPPVLILVAACRADPLPAALQVGVIPAAPTTADTVYATLDGEPLDAEDASIRWTRRADGLTVEGPSLPSPITERYDVWTVEVARGGATGTAQATIVNSAPSALITLPEAADARVPLRAIAFVEDADGDPVEVTWRWRVDGADAGLLDDEVPETLLARGQRWQAEATLRDDAARITVLSEEVVLGNAPPSVSLQLEPALPDATTGLTASLAASDVDGDTVTTSLQWFRNGVAWDGASPGPVARGEVWSAVVSASDGDASEQAQATVAIANAAPSVATAHVDPVGVARDTPPSCLIDGAVDPDGDAVTTTVVWDVDGARWSSPILDPARYARGQSVRCIATPFDGTRAGTAVESAPVVVRNTPPTLTGATLSPLTPSTLDPIAILPTGRADLDGDVVRWDATWFSDGELLHQGLFLPAGLARRDAQIWAVVTPTDGFDEGPPVTTPSIPVVNAPPSILAVTAAPNPPRPDIDWVVDVMATDPDGDPWSATATFTVDGVVQPDTAGLRLPKEALLGATTAEVWVQVSDGERDAAPVRLGPFAVGNGRPSVTDVVITPDSPTARDIMTCHYGAISDPENDPADVTYAWTVNGRPAYVGPSLPAGLARRGALVTCAVTAGDAGGVGAPSEATVAVANAPPVLVTLAWASLPLVDGVALDVIAEVDDPDNEPLALHRTWTVNGVEVPAEGGALPATAFARDDRVAVTVRASDGTALSDPLSLDAESVANAPPRVTVSLSPTPITAGTGALAAVEVDDPDADATTWSLSWTVDGVTLDLVDNPLPGAALRRGASVQATVLAEDAEGATTVATSEAVEVDNAAPVGRAHLEPARPIAALDDLRCVPEGDRDADGDGVTWTVAWTQDGQPWPAPGDALSPTSEAWTGDTVPAAALDVGAVWRCTATPYDVEGPGAPAQAETSVWFPATRVLAAGGGTTCAILPDGTPRCWGDNAAGQAGAPQTTLTDLAVGYDAAVGLKPDGRLVPWGDPLLYGVPIDRFLSVSVGDDHACGRTRAGGVRCWGFDVAGRTSAPSGTYIDLAVGLFHSCGILEDGHGICWGDNTFGQSAPPPGTWVDVVAGDLDTCWRDAAGSVRCVGLDPALGGPLGDGWTGMAMGSAGVCLWRPDVAPTCLGSAMPAGAPNAPVDGVALGVGFGCARLTEQGATLCWGEEPHGAASPPGPVDALVTGTGLAWRVGDAWSGFGPYGPPPAGVTDVLALGATGGVAHDGVGWAPWGDTVFIPSIAVLDAPTPLSAGTDHVVGLRDGEVVAWGRGPALDTAAPAGPWLAASAAGDHTLLLDGAGQLTCWGACQPPPAGPWTRVAAGRTADCALDTLGALTCWGGAAWTLPDAGLIDLAVATSGGCALAPDGDAACFGALALPDAVYVGVFSGADTVCGWQADGDVRCDGAFAR